jgi:hypothetical protein
MGQLLSYYTIHRQEAGVLAFEPSERPAAHLRKATTP